MRFILQKRKLGPGSYEIKDFLEVSDMKPRSTRGIVETRDSRFKETVAVSLSLYNNVSNLCSIHARVYANRAVIRCV